jgi:ArsR family transcriptional regulator
MNRGSKSPGLDVLFAALADPTRLRLLNLMAGDGLMAGREVCVCHFVEILGQGQPKISRHLAYLRKAGIAAARREGKWMHYSICAPANPSAASIFAAVLAAFASDRQMKADLSKLDRSKPDQSKPDQCDVELNQLKLSKPGLSKPERGGVGLCHAGQSKRKWAQRGARGQEPGAPGTSARACLPVRLKGKSSGCGGKAESA